MKKLLVLTICFFVVSAVKCQVTSADQILGDWISPEKDLIVRCYKENNLYYSKVVWFKRYYDDSPDDPNGLPEDKWLNSVIMNSFSYANNEWADGEIYNLKNGKKYSAYIKLNNENKLKVVGYVFFRMFSESVFFTRYINSKLPNFD
jgi:uncharacterized protein (DUF2147 family)